MHETITELNKRKLINDMAKFALNGLISEKIFKYAAIRGINLHFTFSHPAAKQTFEMNRENIKGFKPQRGKFTQRVFVGFKVSIKQFQTPTG